MVLSDQITVMVSPLSNPGTGVDFGSSAISERIDGPAFCPKFPSRTGETEVESSDVFAELLRSLVPSSFTVRVKLPIAAAPPVASSIVITRVNGSNHTPV